MRGYSAIGLFNPKRDINVGAVMRAAGNFGVSLVAYTGHRYTHGCTDTMKTSRHIPLVRTEDLHNIIPFDCVPVAVELVPGATPLWSYPHPERAFYIFGNEDGTLGKAVLGWCRDVVFVPSWRCSNLAACVNVVLYDRTHKRREDYGAGDHNAALAHEALPRV